MFIFLFCTFFHNCVDGGGGAGEGRKTGRKEKASRAATPWMRAPGLLLSRLVLTA
jgi:hypothetical protein